MERDLEGFTSRFHRMQVGISSAIFAVGFISRIPIIHMYSFNIEFLKAYIELKRPRN
jgi:hypothetical protein